MSPEHKARLEALPGWSWDPFLEKWEEGFRNLKEFADREGYSTVPRDYKRQVVIDLVAGSVYSGQIKDSMSLERKARLEALPGWSWDPHSDMWEEGFRLSEGIRGKGRTYRKLFKTTKQPMDMGLDHGSIGSAITRTTCFQSARHGWKHCPVGFGGLNPSSCCKSIKIDLRRHHGGSVDRLGELRHLAQAIKLSGNEIHHQLHLGQMVVAFVAHQIQAADRIGAQIDIEFL